MLSVAKSFDVSVVLIALFLISSTIAPPLFANPPQPAAHGVFRVVKGDVQVKAFKTGKTTRARVGAKVFPQDLILAGKDSRAKIVMIDNNEINISPESQIVFEKYEFDPKQQKKDVLLNVIYGKVRSKVKQKYDGKTSQFQVKTPAAVAGVRGTDFLTSFDQKTKTSNVVTFEGEVVVGTPGPGGRIQNQVAVGRGQSSSVGLGQRPSPAQAVPAATLQDLNRDSDAETATSSSSSSQTGPLSVDEGSESDSGQNDVIESVDEGSDMSSGSENETSSDAGNEDLNSGTSSEGLDTADGSDPSAQTESTTGEQANSSDSAGGSLEGTGLETGETAAGETNSAGEGNSSSRSPSSVSSGGGSSGLLLPEDFAGNDLAPMPENPSSFMPAAPPVIPVVEQVPICDFCNRVIENGPARVLIRISN